MKPVEWKTYRTRFLVKAKQLSSALSFTDHLGRQHSGRKGDYLVESSDGVLSIAPRQIFEDIYVPMGFAQEPSPQESQDQNQNTAGDNLRLARLRVEQLRIEKVKGTFPDRDYVSVTPERPSRIQRKVPQSVRGSASRLSLM